MSSTNEASAPAVVVGLCSHGLATVRALRRRGIRVHALEADSDLPGASTRAAEVHIVPGINGEGLIESLRDARSRIASDVPPVLFLMNDNMVRELATRWPELDGRYRLSWSHGREQVGRLLRKSAIEARCREVGLSYPSSRTLDSEDDLDRVVAELRGPFILKPVRPLSAFKVKLVATPEALRRVVREFRESAPFLVQEWVPGGDERIHFGALFLDRGEPIATFVGQKLRSSPKALGQTTMARSSARQDVLDATTRFFDGLGLSGPVSLELKQDDRGTLWVIEPTLGRTDFWLACCIENGVDLPYIEYRHQTGEERPPSRQIDAVVWTDTERDPLGIVWYLLSPRGWLRFRRPVRFPYWKISDMRPFYVALARTLVRLARTLPGRVVRRVARSVRRG